MISSKVLAESTAVGLVTAATLAMPWVMPEPTDMAAVRGAESATNRPQTHRRLASESRRRRVVRQAAAPPNPRTIAERNRAANRALGQLDATFRQHPPAVRQPPSNAMQRAMVRKLIRSVTNRAGPPRRDQPDGPSIQTLSPNNRQAGPLTTQTAEHQWHNKKVH